MKATPLEKVSAYLFFAVCGYCIGRQLICIYYAYLDLKKARRDSENSYMNLLVSIEDAAKDSMV